MATVTEMKESIKRYERLLDSDNISTNKRAILEKEKAQRKAKLQESLTRQNSASYGLDKNQDEFTTESVAKEVAPGATAAGLVTSRYLQTVNAQSIVQSSDLYNWWTPNNKFNEAFKCTAGNNAFVDEMNEAIKGPRNPKSSFGWKVKPQSVPTTSSASVTPQIERITEVLAKHKGDTNLKIANEAAKLSDELDDLARAGKSCMTKNLLIGKSAFTKGNVILTAAGGAVDLGMSAMEDYEKHGGLTEKTGKAAVEVGCGTAAAVAGIGASTAIGAKAGALVGSFIPIPGVGTVAGCAVGAVAGAVCYGVGKFVGSLINKLW